MLSVDEESFLRFLSAAHGNTVRLVRYNQRNLSHLLFHAKNEGFDFTGDEVAEVIGRLEADVILNKDGDPYDGSSRLWREMWGKYHFEYLAPTSVERDSMLGSRYGGRCGVSTTLSISSPTSCPASIRCGRVQQRDLGPWLLAQGNDIAPPPHNR